MDLESPGISNTPQQPSQASQKKLFIILGIAAFLLILAALLVTFFVSKSNADARAASYQERSKTYVASLESTDGKKVKGDFANPPKLEDASFNFLSSKYQQASAKQAALAEDIAFLKKVNDGYSYIKDDIRKLLYYDQSEFFFDRYKARTNTYVKVTSDMPDKSYARIVAKQYTDEASAAKTYLKKLKNTSSQPLHAPEATKLQKTLESFIQKADDCAQAARQKPTEARKQAADCNKSLNRYYYDSLVYYGFIGFFPYSLEEITPSKTLLDVIKKHQAESFKDISADEAKLHAVIDTRVALIKTILPTSTKDKQFGVKADIVRALNQHLSDAIKSAAIPNQKKAAYEQKLAPAITSLTMYDNPSDKGPDDAGGFVGTLTDIISSHADSSIDSKGPTQHYALYSERLQRLKSLDTPVYVKEEIAKVIAVYESSLKHFKESDELSKKAEDATKRSEEKSGSLGAISYAIDAYKYTRESNDKFYEGVAVIDKANPYITKIGAKIDNAKAMTKQVIRQYDDLLGVL